VLGKRRIEGAKRKGMDEEEKEGADKEAGEDMTRRKRRRV
jgi:hypothetical protein